MTNDDSNPFAGTPPEWVPLTDVPQLIEQKFGIPARQSADRLRGELQDGRIRHRIAGLRRGDLDRNVYREVVEPPGLDWRSNDDCAGVSDWGRARVDWLTGTVTGRRLPDGTRARHKIELNWREIEKIALVWREDTERAQPAERALPKSTLATQARPAGGSPPKHDWDAFWIEIALYASANDLFQIERSELQRHMQNWAEQTMGDPAPDPATVRRKIKALYEAIERARN